MNLKNAQPNYLRNTENNGEMPMNVTKEEVKAIVDQALMDHEGREKANVRSEIDALLKSLVPHGDPKPHHDYHMAKLKAAIAQRQAEDARRKLYEALLKIVLEKGVEGVFKALGILFWLSVMGLLVFLGKGVPEWLWGMLK